MSQKHFLIAQWYILVYMDSLKKLIKWVLRLLLNVNTFIFGSYPEPWFCVNPMQSNVETDVDSCRLYIHLSVDFWGFCKKFITIKYCQVASTLITLLCCLTGIFWPFTKHFETTVMFILNWTFTWTLTV